MSLQSPNPSNKRNAINMAMAAFAGQVGCVTLVIVMVALFGGIALDGALNTKPWITVGMVVISVPISLFIMFKIAAKTIAKIQAVAPDQKSKEKEENLGGTDS